MPTVDRIPAKLLIPMLRDLQLRDVAVDQVLDCPGGRLALAPILSGDMVSLDHRDFVHAYGLCTLLLEQASCHSQAKSKNRSKALEAFLNFVVAADTLKEACERSAEFNAFLEERGYSIHLSAEDDTAKFSIDFNPSMAHPPLSIVSSSIIYFYNLFSWLTATPVTLLRSDFLTFINLTKIRV